MLEKPDIQDEQIIACLRDAYGLQIVQFDFLPLGADRNSAVYRAVAADGSAYFVKLRRDGFNEVSVIIPRLLHDQGVNQVILPITARSGALWVLLDGFHLTLYPFLTGSNGYEIPLTDHHWIEFGRALKGVHSAVLPPDLAAHIPRESYSGHWRTIMKQFQQQVEETTFDDPVSAALAALLKAQEPTVSTLVRRAERLGAILQSQAQDFILCHADIHAANLLIDANNTLYIVDWDTLILAPKERDLMFVGGGRFDNKRTPEQEETGFYQGYGQTQVDPVALAYYRYQRIVEDIAKHSEEIFLTDPSNQDRAVGVHRVSNNFLSGAMIDITYRTEKFLPSELQGL